VIGVPMAGCVATVHVRSRMTLPCAPGRKLLARRATPSERPRMVLASLCALARPIGCVAIVRGSVRCCSTKKQDVVRSWLPWSPEAAQTASLAALWKVLRPEQTRLKLALASLCASSAVNMAYPILAGRLVDLFGDLGSGGLDFIMSHAVGCGGLVLLGGIATFSRLFLIETAIERTAYRLRHELMNALLRRDIAFFDHNKTGELITRLSNDITVTSRVIIDVSAGIRSSISALVGTFMVFSIAPSQMMVTLLGPVVVLFAGGVGYGRFVRHVAQEKQQRLAEAVQLAEERLSGIRVVRFFNAEERETRNFDARLDHVYETGRKYALASGGMSAFVVSGGGLFMIHLIYNCGVLVTTGVVSIGTTVTLAMYSFLAASSYVGLMTAFGDVQKSLGSCQKVLDILNEVPANSHQSVAVPVASEAPLAVRFEGINFSYPLRPEAPVIRGLDLDIPAGARVALLGGSGSGKSTVALLLGGLYAPSSGRILVDGHDIVGSDELAAWTRGQLGIVSQEPTLFALSIRDNIAYGVDGEIGDNIRAASATAHVDEFVPQLPDGLDTAVGERGMALSGGQRQRVCIARALARSPRMLVFDEATSSLDIRSEGLVNAALSTAFAQRTRTCLVITHRLSALQWVDRVAVMHDGRIVQYGERDFVMSNPCEALAALIRSERH